jgi:two-component system, cell cycle sensor histidine kinase and response regulator CckA
MMCRTTDGEGQPSGFVAILDDVTAVIDAEERRRTEQQRRAELDRERIAARLDSLRRLAGGVAHGYNNAFAVILANAEFLGERITAAAEAGRLEEEFAAAVTRDLKKILTASHKAVRLTRQLQSFGHRGPRAAAAGDLNASLCAAVAQIRPGLPEGQVILTTYASGLPPVTADSDQIGHILRHLVANAVEAMPQGGVIWVETGLSRTALEADPDAGSSAAEVQFTVRDNGPGMTAQVREHAIEPFFSTKPRGSSAGLGLTTAYSLAHQAGGELIIESAEGQGTTMRVLLPVAHSAATIPPPAPASATPADRLTILVVDDEEEVRMVVAEIVRRAGHHVLQAASGEAALQVSAQYRGPIHCLLTDLVMPGIPGTELARRLIAGRPATAVVYMSGFAEPLTDDDLTNAVEVIPKPFTSADILTALQAATEQAAKP